MHRWELIRVSLGTMQWVQAAYCKGERNQGRTPADWTFVRRTMASCVGDIGYLPTSTAYVVYPDRDFRLGGEC